MNNRQIKFRAWDTQYKRWVDDGFGIENTTGYLFENEANYLPYEPHDRFVLMQYTGLKDKNGREIYEGDWIDGYGQVTFNHGAFGVCSFKGDWGWFLGTISEEENIEIIGNVFENPELLEQADHE